MNETQQKDSPPYIVFETRAMEDRTATIANGHYTTKDVIFAIVTRPGGRDSHEEDATSYGQKLVKQAQNGLIPREWPDLYQKALAAFRNNEELPETGTPIKGWQLLPPSAQQQLLRLGFRTVENLAEAGDGELQNVGLGGIQWREKARIWLKDAQTAGASTEKIAALSQKVSDLSELTERLLAENKELREKLPKPAVHK